MKTFLSLLLVAVLTLARAAQAQPAPALISAQIVAHAAHATMLSSTRAGSRIVAVGDHGVVLLSDDDGATFRQASAVPIDSTLTSVSFVDPRQGWAAGHWGVVLHTVDGGEHWAIQRSDVKNDRPLFALHFFDAKRGVAVGLWSLVIATDDGGASWQTISVPVPEGAKKADLNLLGLFVDAKGHLYAPAERGMVLRSDDEGRTWAYLSTGYKGSLWTGVATRQGALLVGGLRGSMYRSVDEGRSWTRIDTASKSSITDLAESGGEIVGVGLDGLVLRSKDDGVTFASEVRADRISLTTLVLGDHDRPVLFSRQGVVSKATPAPEQSNP